MRDMLRNMCLVTSQAWRARAPSRAPSSLAHCSTILIRRACQSPARSRSSLATSAACSRRGAHNDLHPQDRGLGASCSAHRSRCHLADVRRWAPSNQWLACSVFTATSFRVLASASSSTWRGAARAPTRATAESSGTRAGIVCEPFSLHLTPPSHHFGYSVEGDYTILEKVSLGATRTPTRAGRGC